MKSFDRAAQTYESFGFIQREMAAWLAEWKPKQTIGAALEVASGTGLFTRHLLPWQGPFLATDAAPAMVEHGRTALPKVEWQTASADSLPDVSVDWIFSSSFLQWADDPVRMFEHWKSHLNPNGRILAGFFVAPTLAELENVLPGASPLEWRLPAAWEAALARSGFRLLRSEAVERVFTFPNALHLLRTLHRIGAAPARRFPPAILRRTLRAYDERYTGRDGIRSTWTFFRLEAEG